MFGNKLINTNAGGGCTNTVDLYNPFPDGGGVALYQLNGDATDVSGNYNGTATNVTYGAGVFGQAGIFNGSSSFVDLGATNQFQSPQVAISLWIKPTSFSSQIIIGNGNGGSFADGDFHISIRTDGYIGYEIGISSSIYEAKHCTTTQLQLNAWNNVVLVLNSSLGTNISKIYVNNIEQSLANTYASGGTFSGNLLIGSLQLNLGKRNISGNELWFNGSIDQVRIFSRALRPYEVEALYTEEYCTPTIVPSEHFNTVTYDGQATDKQVTGVGFQPDLVWVKCRDVVNSHVLADSVRGSNGTTYYSLFSDLTNAESSSNQIKSLDLDGFTVWGDRSATNRLNQTYVSWNFKAGGAAVTNTDGTITSQVSANTEAGFSIVAGTSLSSDGNFTIGHGLGVAPNFYVIKNRTSTGSWLAYSSELGASKYLLLNSTNAAGTDLNFWNNTAPTSSVFTMRSGQAISNNSDFIAYCFAEVEGFSNFGSYVGTGTTSGNVVVTGFEPAFVMVKRTDAAGNSWLMVDNKRVAAGNEKHELFANTSTAESGTGYDVAFLENGFQMQTTTSNANASGGKYIYMAFAADPTAVEPTLEDSFNTVTYTGTGTNQQVTGIGFEPDLVWIKSRTTTNPHVLHDTVRGIGNVLYSNLTNAEGDESPYFTGVGDGFLQFGINAGNYNNTGTNYVAWNWKGAEIPAINSNGSIPSVVSANPAAGFSIVSYTGNGVNATIGHGLGEAPKVLIIKNRDEVENWAVGHEYMSATPWNNNMLFLNATNSVYTSIPAWGNQSPTSTTFGVGANLLTNSSGKNHIAYCFAEVAGFSKFGSYSGAVTPNFQDCGFEPAFVIIKSSTNSAAGWLVFDNVRGTDKRLYPYAGFAEYDDNGSPIINFTLTGFSFNDNNAWTNGTIHDYIYMAFANQF